MKNKFWFGGGLLLIAAALCFAGYNFWDEERAEKRTEKIISQYQACQMNLPQEQSDSQPDDQETGAVKEIPQDGEVKEDQRGQKDAGEEMPVIVVEGNPYIGTLEIPALEVSLPVMEEWNYANLKLAPCRYKGSVYQDNLIIAGHNYRSHFGGLRTLEAGDTVIFTDAENKQVTYQVTQVILLDGYDVEGMEEGEWDLALFTCTADSRSRVTVRCKRTSPDKVYLIGRRRCRNLFFIHQKW